ncbi:cytochrome c [Viridibacterium curvum]|uniref:Cytochrome c domain-containing protein n=1 Tax=Viridibacterium curvum TaxID=1101404 RepID=A0ABP9Q9E7_9RHOO
MNKILMLVAFALAATQAQAAGDAARGQAKSAACAACHGADGNSAVPTFPKLAGQNEDYLVHALKSYKNGTRKNDVMKGMAAPLSEQDIADLAAYFAKQSGLVVKR